MRTGGSQPVQSSDLESPTMNVRGVSLKFFPVWGLAGRVVLDAGARFLNAEAQCSRENRGSATEQGSWSRTLDSGNDFRNFSQEKMPEIEAEGEERGS